MTTGVAGQIRCVVKKADGTVRMDTDYQKNMILDTGLDFFGGGHGEDMFAHCVIGSGQTAPQSTDTQLASFLAVHGSIEDESYDAESYLSGESKYKTWRSCTYRFANLPNQGISEVGLASQYTSGDDYYLCTKALIKSVEGEPITITLKDDEVLEITYRVWQIFSTADTSAVVNVADDIGGSVSYNVKCRLAGVSDEGAFYPYKVGLAFAPDKELGSPTYNDFYSYAGNIGQVTGAPTISMGAANEVTLSEYEAGSYTRDITLFFGLDDARFPVRSVLLPTTMGTYQIEYGSVDGDEPIPKSKNDTLTVPMRFTWARYEGQLDAAQ